MKRFATRAWVPPRPLVLPSLISGVLLAAAFPPLSLGVLSFVALVPICVAIHRRPYSRSAYYKAGYLVGNAFFLGLMWWIVGLLPSSSLTIPGLMVPALALLVLYLSVYPGLAFLTLRVLGSGKPLSTVLLLPVMWVVFELVRSSGELAFSWGTIGYSLAPYPLLLQTAAIVGVFGVGLLILAVNGLVACAFLAEGGRAKVLSAGSAVVLVAGMAVYGARAIHRYDLEPRGATSRVAVAQPNVDLRIKWEPAYVDSTLHLIERLTREAAAHEAQVTVFPETSAPVFIHHDPTYRMALSSLARELGVEIFIGFLDHRYSRNGRGPDMYNSSGLFHSHGGLTQYDKMHLLPFGEAIPYAWRFPALKRLNFGQGNFEAGTSDEPIPSSIGRLAPLICFESIFPESSRRSVAAGADVLVNITNDGWFGDSPGVAQHGMMAILRAVENRRYLLRSANTGISMVVDPVGRVVSSLDVDTEGLLIEDIRNVRGQTPYTKWGDRAAALLGLVLSATGVLVARRA